MAAKACKGNCSPHGEMKQRQRKGRAQYNLESHILSDFCLRCFQNPLKIAAASVQHMNICRTFHIQTLTLPSPFWNFFKAQSSVCCEIPTSKASGQREIRSELRRFQTFSKLVSMSPWRHLYLLCSLGLYVYAHSHTGPLEKIKFSMIVCWKIL